MPATLTARRYEIESELIFDVVDPGGPASGRWLLQTGADGSAVTPTTADPDVTLLAGDLGSLYLGGAPASTLARAGRVHGSTTALDRADKVLRCHPRPLVRLTTPFLATVPWHRTVPATGPRGDVNLEILSLPAFAEQLGAPPPEHVPVALARLAIGPLGAVFMNGLAGASNHRARHVLGWRPRFTTFCRE